MKNNIIYNVFTKDEIKDIETAVSLKKDDTEVQTFLGRTRLDYSNKDIDNLPHSILSKANDLIKEFSDKDKRRYSFKYFTLVEYNNEFGMPQLGPHKDTCAFTGTILCQLDSNVSWDIYVEGIPYTLIDNSALLINARDQDHWRIHKEFNDGDYLKMVFLHYLDLDDQEMNVSSPDQLHEVNMKWAHITGYKPEERTYNN
jgi:hypothetical protein